MKEKHEDAKRGHGQGCQGNHVWFYLIRAKVWEEKWKEIIWRDVLGPHHRRLRAFCGHRRGGGGSVEALDMRVSSIAPESSPCPRGAYILVSGKTPKNQTNK